MYLKTWYSIGGYDEHNSNIDCDEFIIDYYNNSKTYEDCEILMLKKTVDKLIDINKEYLVIGGNLCNQLSTFYELLSNYNFPCLGLYSACATFVESLIISKYINSDNILVLISSHTLESEKQFRFPIEYGNLKKSYSTNTITATIGLLLTKEVSKYKLDKFTIGKVIDSTIKDSSNMGAVMAPSCANTIYRHIYENKRTISDYDYIITGDLGKLGLKLLQEILKNDYGIETNKIIDAGSMIYKDNQNKNMGGSGPTVLPYVLLNKILKEKFKRILIVGTGSLHSPTLVNQAHTIPAISHAIEIEANYD